MATNITTTDITRTGVAAGAGTAGATDMTFNNDGHTVLRVVNTGVEKTVTLAISRTVDGQTPAARTVTVPATTGDVFIGPFPVADYSPTMAFSLSGTTGVLCWAYHSATD